VSAELSFFLPFWQRRASIRATTVREREETEKRDREGRIHDRLLARAALELSLSCQRRAEPYLPGRFNALSWSWGIGFLILALGLMVADPAAAHTRSQSFSSWHIEDGQVRLSFSVQSLEVTRLGLMENDSFALDKLLVKHLTPRITVSVGGKACRTVIGPQARTARAGYLRAEWRFACPTEGPIEITNDAFFAVAPSHVHYARVRVGNGPPTEYLFTNSERRHLILTDGQAQPQSRGASFVAYVVLGIEHILIGIDHIAFLLALLLLCRRVREVTFMVTGFTLGHSLTLSLAVLGLVTPNVPVIEALIGFTIALVAVENISITSHTRNGIAVTAGMVLATLVVLKILGQFGPPLVTLIGLTTFTLCYLLLTDTQEQAAQLRPMLTILFGLIHGFGFASVLMEMRLPTDRLVPALLGFNIGVEIGQLGIVAALWITGTLIVRRVPAADYRLAVDAASAALCALGLFWFVTRAWG
jgi:HupE/UreJ protein